MTASQTPGSPWKNHTRAALLPLSTILNHSARVYLNRRLQSLHTPGSADRRSYTGTQPPTLTSLKAHASNTDTYGRPGENRGSGSIEGMGRKPRVDVDV